MPNGRTAPIPDPHRDSRTGFLRPIGATSALAILFLVVSTNASADSGARERFGGELNRWELAGAGEIGVYARTAEASASGTLLVGPRAANVNRGNNRDGPDTVIADIEGENDVYSLLLGTTLSAMTPSLIDIPTQPRILLDLSILAPSTLESAIARQGSPGRFGLPEANVNVLVINEPQVLGTGTEVSSQEQDYQLHAAIGVAFTVDLGENRVRFKPTFRYSRSQNVVSAVAKRAVRVVSVDPIIPGQNERFRSLDGYRLLALSDEQKEIYHGIGAGLEVEYLTDNRIGPFELSLYMKGGATYLLGDLKTSFFQSNPEYPAESVTFRYKNDPWAYQAATGIRLRFSPGRPR